MPIMANYLEDNSAWTAVLDLSSEELTQLERQDLARWREWHEAAIGALADRLRAKEESKENHS